MDNDFFALCVIQTLKMIYGLYSNNQISYDTLTAHSGVKLEYLSRNIHEFEPDTALEAENILEKYSKITLGHVV